MPVHLLVSSFFVIHIVGLFADYVLICSMVAHILGTETGMCSVSRLT
jgi:hypothetical protein